MMTLAPLSLSLNDNASSPNRENRGIETAPIFQAATWLIAASTH